MVKGGAFEVDGVHPNVYLPSHCPRASFIWPNSFTKSAVMQFPDSAKVGAYIGFDASVYLEKRDDDKARCGALDPSSHYVCANAFCSVVRERFSRVDQPR
jgi:hypothetical protein